MSELKQKIAAVAGQPCLSSLASLTEDGKPWVRFVVSLADRNFNFRFATSLDSRKVTQMRKNPDVHLTLGQNTIGDMTHPWLQVAGKAEIHTDEAERLGFWNDMFKAYFSGPDDPNFCVVVIRPTLIEYMTTSSPQPEVWRP